MVWTAAERDDFVVDVRSMRRRVEEVLDLLDSGMDGDPAPGSLAAADPAVVSEAPRPSVVTSFVVWATPWNPATITTLSSVRDFSTRPGVMSMMRALPWVGVVMMPAWEPV